MKNNDKTITFHLPSDLKEKLFALKEKEKRSYGNLCRIIIQKYLAEVKNE